MYAFPKEGSMTTGHPEGLKLTEEEAFSLLGMCLTSPQSLDAISERALRKLAEYCTTRSNSTEIIHKQPQAIHLSVS